MIAATIPRLNRLENVSTIANRYRGVENTMPKQPFWFFLTWISILWYAYLVFHVGWKGFHDIRRMIRAWTRTERNKAVVLRQRAE